MIELNNDELLEIDGGAGLTAAFMNAGARLISTVMDVGRSLGSAIRRAIGRTACPI